MQKIPSVFKRDYEGTRKVFDEVVEGCEWVLAGEGQATAKWDGTCCRIRFGDLYRRYDRKPMKAARKRGKPYADADDFKPAPDGWEAAEVAPNLHTGHWPGWLPIGDGPQDKYHREALEWWLNSSDPVLVDGTYELVGPKVQGNPHQFEGHTLVRHGIQSFKWNSNPRTFEEIREWLDSNSTCEGIVWHHPDGRMAKIKRKDFGFQWPPKRGGE